MALKNIPQAERLLSGTLTSYLSDVATTCVMSDPPSKFPTYIDIEPDSTTKKELIRAVAVSGSTVTIERSVNGVVTDHAANATYKQKITSRHWDAVSDALEKGLLMEDALRVLTRVSDTQFTITGYGASDDLTGTYSIGRVLRINSSASYVMTVTSSSYSAGTNKTTIDVSATLPTPVSTVEFGIAPLGGTNLPLTSPVLTTPKVVTSINDANGNEVIKTPATTSAVNEVTVTNSATGNAVQVSATGGDTNIDLKLVAKGTGAILDKNSDALSPNSSMARQAIMNGNFDVWQRLTTVTNPASGSYIPDRWRNAFAVDGGTPPSNIIISRQSLTAGNLNNSFYYLRINPDEAGSGYGNGSIYYMLQRIENATRFLCGDGRKVTVSFYARASVASKKLGITLIQKYGTGGTPTSQEILTGTAVTLTSSWAKYTYTFTTNTLASKTFGTAGDDHLEFGLATQWGSTTGTSQFGGASAEGWGGSGTIDIAQVQLCAGDVALPFQPKSEAQEKADCQRFCQARTVAGFEAIGQGTAGSTTVAYIQVPFHTEMRTTPTLVATAAEYVLLDHAGAGVDLTALAMDASSDNKYVGVVTATVAAGLTQYRTYYLAGDNGGTRTLYFEAEL